VGPHARAIEEHHPELDPTLLNKGQQALPDTRPGPADKDLGRAPPGAQLLRDGPPLSAVLVPPEDGRDGAAQVLRCGLAFGSARLDQGLQQGLLSIAEHGSSSVRNSKTPMHPVCSSDNTPCCLVAERCWDRVRWAIENYTWCFDGSRRPPRAWWRI
jgi:hypothetical protein